MKLAIIPARGGGKRIPRKNNKPFYGKLIIAWMKDKGKETKTTRRKRLHSSLSPPPA